MTALVLGWLWKLRWPLMVAVLLVVVWLHGYFHGRLALQARCTAAQARCTAAIEAIRAEESKRLAIALHAQQQRTAEVEAAHVQAQQKLQARARVINKEVVRYVAHLPGTAACGLDADGMRIWTSANAEPGDPADATSGADAAVPAAAAAAEPDAGGSAGEPRGRGAAVPRVPGAAPGADAVGTTANQPLKGD